MSYSLKNPKISMTRFVGVVLLMILAVGGCAVQSDSAARATAAVTVADIGTTETWGGADNVVSVKHLYFSEQPDAATLTQARDRGVGVVINLRDPSEFDWDEANAAATAGLTYYNVPIASRGNSFDAEAIEKIGALVKKHSDERVLLHCSSGNRASAWLAIHLVNDHGMNVDTSISLAKRAGLTKPNIETRVRNYLHDGEVSPAATK